MASILVPPGALAKQLAALSSAASQFRNTDKADAQKAIADLLWINQQLQEPINICDPDIMTNVHIKLGYATGVLMRLQRYTT